ncbi:MAG TPA: hypothetical protein VFO19_04785, partial [Vicinamibacterales bacterium]|nr:hypothetical protein [Vicinamibacterales bacterium]
MTTVAARVATNPFLALRSFKREDAAKFFGRDADLVLIQSRLFSSRCTLLFAAAGVGKSSFLDAKLAPAVESQWTIVTHRAWAVEPPLAALQASVAAKASAQAEPTDLVSQVEQVIDSSDGARGCLVVLDQFEEVFQHWRDSKALDEFAREVARLVHTPGLEARVLISMREEFLGELSLFDNLIPDLFNNCYRLKNATLGEAEEIITRTAMLCGVECGPGLDALLVDLVNASSRIDPARRAAPSPHGEPSPRGRIPMPFLQIVCYRLWQQQMLGAAARTVFLEQAPGPVRGELEAYCREKLKTLSAREQDLAAASFGFLMTRSGAKMAYPIDVLAEQARVDETALLAVLDRLAAEDVRILREIPAGPNSKPWFELYHDLYSRFLSDWKREHDTVGEAQRSRKSMATMAVFLIASGVVVAGLTAWRASRLEVQHVAEQLLLRAEDLKARNNLETALGIRLRLESFVRNPDLARESLRNALDSTLIEIGRYDLPDDPDLIALSPDGELLCAVDADGIRLIRLPEGTAIGEEIRRTARVSAIAFDPSGGKL